LNLLLWGIMRVKKSKSSLTDVAEDTLQCLERGSYIPRGKRAIKLETLQPAITGSQLYKEDAYEWTEWQVSPEERPFKETKMIVSGLSVLECIHTLKNPAMVLNFASSRNPGGGFQKGSQAQEESLVRSSGLYPCLCQFRDDMYHYHKQLSDPMNSHRMIFSPSVPFFKNDRGNYVDPYVSVSILSSPAVNAKMVLQAGGSKSTILMHMHERMRRILMVTLKKGFNIVVLGAYGCGVFKNEAADIAYLWYKLLKTEFVCCFEEVYFPCADNLSNLHAFEAVFRGDFSGVSDELKT